MPNRAAACVYVSQSGVRSSAGGTPRVTGRLYGWSSWRPTGGAPRRGSRKCSLVGPDFRPICLLPAQYSAILRFRRARIIGPMRRLWGDARSHRSPASLDPCRTAALTLNSAGADAAIERAGQVHHLVLGRSAVPGRIRAVERWDPGPSDTRTEIARMPSNRPLEVRLSSGLRSRGRTAPTGITEPAELARV